MFILILARNSMLTFPTVNILNMQIEAQNLEKPFATELSYLEDPSLRSTRVHQTHIPLGRANRYGGFLCMLRSTD